MKVSKVWFRENQLTPQLQPRVDPEREVEIRALRQEILRLLQKQRFVSFVKQPKFLFDNQLRCLWLLHGFQARGEEVFQHLSRLQIYTFKNWELPSVEELKSVAREKLFREHEKFSREALLSKDRSFDGKGFQTVRIGSGEEGVSEEEHMVIPVHRVAQRDIFSFIVANSLLPQDVAGVTEKLNQLYALTLDASRKQHAVVPPSLRALKQLLLEGDYLRARLPVLEESYLLDMEKGLWELYQPRKPFGSGWIGVELKQPWEARNPEKDVKDGVVAIDFGTSSTVVACRENGKITLLRVGMSDFFRKPVPEDYQNPTILEFINLPQLLDVWKSEAYRPLTRWDDFHFSHEALNNFRENEANQVIVASMVTAIKQWPLHAHSGEHFRFTDQATGYEMEIAPSLAPMPVPGQRVTVGKDDPFDPIELYAYYLGLFINSRSNGLFLEYYMTFPVTYPKEVKYRIRASFARGLMRSLPANLMDSEKIHRFRVSEEASEPAAYAACALEELEIEPSDDGVAYAVFDFGGGSTDFDFGIYRSPTEEEEKNGYEQVINHFGASGDMYLGGENLVANIAYLVFRDNLEVCREHRIPFSIPPEGERFPGCELFLDHSHVAQTNTALVMAQVRMLWENFQWDVLGDQDRVTGEEGDEPQLTRRLSDRIGDVLSQEIVDAGFTLRADFQSCHPDKRFVSLELELLNRARERTPVRLQVDRNHINHFLVARVGKGVHRFFIAMKQAFGSRGVDPAEIHILQAGNASRALLVQALFAALTQEKMHKWEPPKGGLKKNMILERIQNAIGDKRLIIHRPPPGDPGNPYKPTAKTGVAIGLLKLVPGEPFLSIGPNSENRQGEAPFSFFVGGLKRGRFHPVLRQNGPYYVWEELGVPTRGTFVLVFSTSPQAGLGELRRGSRELKEKSLTFGLPSHGRQLYIQAVAPSRVELCLATSVEQIEKRPEEVLYREIFFL
ncbi:MAG: hypothetical protein HQL84_06455 [Magnetococcales bacterium]|nr:hypothetical protein [Magnetococcales bacterium]MBF0149674.1 hypothetical protein [Magnetococcales bacterium]